MPYIWPAFSSKRRMGSIVAIGGKLLLLAEVGDAGVAVGGAARLASALLSFVFGRRP